MAAPTVFKIVIADDMGSFGRKAPSPKGRDDIKLLKGSNPQSDIRIRLKVCFFNVTAILILVSDSSFSKGAFQASSLRFGTTPIAFCYKKIL